MEVIKLRIRNYEFTGELEDTIKEVDGRTYEDWKDIGLSDSAIKEQFGLTPSSDYLEINEDDLKSYSASLYFKKEDFHYIKEEPKRIFVLHLKDGKSFELFDKKEISKICGNI